MDIQEKIQEYSRIPCVVGFEDAFLDYLERDLSFCEVQRKKGYLVAKKGKGTTILSVHVDRHGLVYDKGTYEHAGLWMKHKLGKSVSSSDAYFEKTKKCFLNQEVSFKGHVGKITDAQREGERIHFTVENISPKQEPTPLGFAPHITLGKVVKGQLDNVLCVAMMWWLLQQDVAITVLFTTQEEIGESWKQVEEFANGEKDIYIVDTTASKELSEEGALVFRASDDIADYDKACITRLTTMAKKLSIPFTIKRGNNNPTNTTTELGRLIDETEEEYTGATIQIPTTNYHTPNEETTKACIDNLALFLLNFFRTRE